LAKYRLLKLLQRPSRVQSQLLHQRASRFAVGLQRFGLTAAAVQREHQLTAQPLAQRMAENEQLELAHGLGVAAERELRVKPILKCSRAQLPEGSRLARGPLLVSEIAERLATPQRQRLPERHDRPLRLAARQQRTPRFGQRSKAEQVDPLRRNPQLVPGGHRHQNLRAERPAQPRDIALQRRRRAPGRLLPPHIVDQTIAGDNTVGVQQQQRQHRALTRATHLDRRPRRQHLHRPQKLELHITRHPAVTVDPKDSRRQPNRGEPPSRAARGRLPPALRSVPPWAGLGV
jgi:hypothetical protein